jgi:hypothetical protein
MHELEAKNIPMLPGEINPFYNAAIILDDVVDGLAARQAQPAYTDFRYKT